MKTNYDEVFSKVSDFLKTGINTTHTNTIVGQPFPLGEFTCAHVIRIGMELNNEKPVADTKKGTDKEVAIEPIGFLVSCKDQIIFIKNQPANVAKGLGIDLDQLPEIIGNYFEKNRQRPVYESAINVQ